MTTELMTVQPEQAAAMKESCPDCGRIRQLNDLGICADCEADAKRIAVDMAADRQDLFLRSGGRDEDTAKRWEKR